MPCPLLLLSMAGGKYAARNDRQAKKEARKQLLEALEDETAPPDYVRPSRQDCETGGPIVWNPSETTCLYAQLWTLDSRLVDFVMLHFVQLRDSEDGWYELARIDCAHGTVHIHEDEGSGTNREPRHLFNLRDPSDVLTGYEIAYDELDLSWKTREGEMHNDRKRNLTSRTRPTGPLPQGADDEGGHG